GSMERSRARLGNRVDDVPHAPPVLGRKSVGLNLELLEFIHRRDEYDSVPVAGSFPMPVNQECGGPETAAAEIEKGDILIDVALAPRRIQSLVLLAVINAGIQRH